MGGTDGTDRSRAAGPPDGPDGPLSGSGDDAAGSGQDDTVGDVVVPAHTTVTATAPDSGGHPATTTRTEDGDLGLVLCAYEPLVPSPLPDAVGSLTDHGDRRNDASRRGGWVADQKATWTITPTKWQKYPDIEIVLRLFLPAPWVVMDDGAGYACALGGDNRGFDYRADDAKASRAFVRMTVNLDPRRDTPLVGDIKADFGYSHTLRSASIALGGDGENVAGVVQGWIAQGAPPPEFLMLRHVDGKPWWWWDWRPDYTGPHRSDETHLARTDSNLSASVASYKPNTARIRVGVCGSVPSTDPVLKATAPTIDADLLLELRAEPDEPYAHFRWTGTHDGFPAYELYLNGSPAYLYSPDQHGKSPLDLMAAMPGHEITVNPGRRWLPLGQALTSG